MTDQIPITDEFHQKVFSLGDNAGAQFEEVKSIFKNIAALNTPVEIALEILRNGAHYLKNYESGCYLPTRDRQRVMSIYTVCKYALFEIFIPDLRLGSEPDISVMDVCRIKVDKVEDLLVIFRGLEVIYLQDYRLYSAASHASLVTHNGMLQSQANTPEVHYLRNWWTKRGPTENGNVNCSVALKDCEFLETYSN